MAVRAIKQKHSARHDCTKSRAPCGHGLGAWHKLQCCRKHQRRTCQGGTGILVAGRTLLIVIASRTLAAGRWVLAPVGCRTPGLAGLFAAHIINSLAPLIHGSGRRPGGSPVCHWSLNTIAWLVGSQDSVVRWSLDSDRQRSPEPPAPRASLEAAIDALAFQRLSAHVDAVCTAGGGRYISGVTEVMLVWQCSSRQE